MTFLPDSPVNDDELLYRAIPTKPDFWKRDVDRPSSASFLQSNGTSVDRDGGRSENVIMELFETRKPGYGLVRIRTKTCRDAPIEAYVQQEPIPENQYHAGIYANFNLSRLTKSQARKLARVCQILRKPGEPIS
jgi:hypothetical protein